MLQIHISTFNEMKYKIIKKNMLHMVNLRTASTAAGNKQCR